MKTLVKFLDKRTRQINILLDLPLKEFNDKRIHRLRVEIKKVKFIIDLLNFNLHGFKEKPIIKSFRKIYKSAGRARDSQIEYAYLKKISGSKDFKFYLKMLSERMRKYEAEFYILFKDFKKEVLRKTLRKLHSLAKTITEKQLIVYLGHLQKETNAIISTEPITVRSLHKIRKILKKYSCAESLLLTRTESKKSNLESLSQLLGDWHDLQIGILQLQKAIQIKKMKPGEYHFLKSCLTELLKSDKDKRALIDKKITSIKFIT